MTKSLKLPPLPPKKRAIYGRSEEITSVYIYSSELNSHLSTKKQGWNLTQKDVKKKRYFNAYQNPIMRVDQRAIHFEG